VFLLGDAAHLTPPFIGQGMGAGLRDAANLTWKLASVLAAGGDERLLDSYQAERKPHVTRVIRNAVTVGWAMTGGQDKAAAVRRVLLTAACRIPGLADLALRTASPRLRSGILVRRRLAWDPLPGTLCPQPWVEDGGDRRRLDDVLGDGFAVIGAGQLDPALATLARRLAARRVDARLGDPPADWLRRGHAGAAPVRPDWVVLATTPTPGCRYLPAGSTARTRTSRPRIRAVRPRQDPYQLNNLLATSTPTRSPGSTPGWRYSAPAKAAPDPANSRTGPSFCHVCRPRPVIWIKASLDTRVVDNDESQGKRHHDRDALADDAGVSAESSGFRGFTLSYIVDRASRVDDVLARVLRSGGEISKPARNALWGYSAYVTDPDGYL
jgi:hypothetical protein